MQSTLIVTKRLLKDPWTCIAQRQCVVKLKCICVEQCNEFMQSTLIVTKGLLKDQWTFIAQRQCDSHAYELEGWWCIIVGVFWYT